MLIWGRVPISTAPTATATPLMSTMTLVSSSAGGTGVNRSAAARTSEFSGRLFLLTYPYQHLHSRLGVDGVPTSSKIIIASRARLKMFSRKACY